MGHGRDNKTITFKTDELKRAFVWRSWTSTVRFVNYGNILRDREFEPGLNVNDLKVSQFQI